MYKVNFGPTAHCGRC